MRLKSMRVILFYVIVVLMSFGFLSTSNAQIWSTNGNDIYYNGGNVGIGTESPTKKLSIIGGQSITYDSNNGGRALVVNASTSSPYAFLKGIDFTLTRSGIGELTNDTVSGKFITAIQNEGDVSGSLNPLIIRTQFGSETPGTTNVTSPDLAGIYVHWWGISNSRTYNISSVMSDIQSVGIQSTSGSGSYSLVLPSLVYTGQGW